MRHFIINSTPIAANTRDGMTAGSQMTAGMEGTKACNDETPALQGTYIDGEDAWRKEVIAIKKYISQMLLQVRNQKGS
eukprot:scaffold112088_cov18-Tisochrysis_lutea.AAC.1